MDRVLVVVDYQKDFVDGTLGFAGAVGLEDGITELVEQYLAAGDRVIFTLDTHGKDYLATREGFALPILHCGRNSDGWQLYGKLRRYMKDDRVSLLTKGSFGSVDYTKLLPAPPDEITLVGVVTNMCVISNAITLQALYPQSHIIIEASLCASFDSELHDKSLDVMGGLQMEVRRTTFPAAE